MLNTGAFKRTLLEKRNKVNLRPSREELDQAAADDEEEEEDLADNIDTAPTEETTFFASQFWKTPEMHGDDELEALLRGEGMC